MNANQSESLAAVFSVFTEIGILNQLATAELLVALGRELGVSEFSVLNHFSRRGGAESPSRLARVFQMTKPSMTAIVGKLAAKGYVTVKPGAEDKRVKLVSITPEGRAARDRALAAAAPACEKIVAEFGMARLAALAPQLTALREYLDEARNERDGLASRSV